MFANAQYASFQNANRGPSPSIWSGVPLDMLTVGIGGHYLFDDMKWFREDEPWASDAATTGTVSTLAGSDIGEMLVDSAAGGADQGINVQFGATLVKPLANRKIYYETRIKVIDLVTEAQLFIGLSEIDTTIFASGENSSANHIGFEANATSIAGTSYGGAGKLQFFGEKAGTRNTPPTADVGLNVHTLVEDDYVKLGFIIDGVTECKVYVNGVFTKDVIPTANIPIVALSPSYACLGESTSDPILTVDWVLLAQVSDDAN